MRHIHLPCLVLSVILCRANTHPQASGSPAQQCNDFECQDSCCPKYGACDPDQGNACVCEDNMDDLVGMYCSHGVRCNDIECQESCCPRYGLCVFEYGPCECQQPSDDYLSEHFCPYLPRECNAADLLVCADYCVKQGKAPEYYEPRCDGVEANVPKCWCAYKSVLE